MDKPYSANNKIVTIKQEGRVLILANEIEIVKGRWENKDYSNYRNERKQICSAIYELYAPIHIEFTKTKDDFPSLIPDKSAAECSKRFTTSEIIKWKSFINFLRLSEDVFEPKFNDRNTLTSIQRTLINIQKTRKYTPDNINIVLNISAGTIRKISEAKECTSAIKKSLEKIWLAQQIIADNLLEELLNDWITITKDNCHFITEAQNQTKNHKQVVALGAKRQKERAEKMSMDDVHNTLGMEELPDD
jgi:ribosomal protein L28